MLYITESSVAVPNSLLCLQKIFEDTLAIKSNLKATYPGLMHAAL